MKPLTQYGLMAERHWREFLPKMVTELETNGQLDAMLLETEERTEAEIDQLRRQLMRQGLTPQLAQDQAWEIVREKYIYLQPEHQTDTRWTATTSTGAMWWMTKLPPKNRTLRAIGTTTVSPTKTGSASAR